MLTSTHCLRLQVVWSVFLGVCTPLAGRSIGLSAGTVPITGVVVELEQRQRDAPRPCYLDQVANNEC